MAESKSEEKAGAIRDVSHPGTTPSSPNSKNVLITNRPFMKDPMMIDSENNEEGKEELEKVTKKSITVKGAGELKVEPPTAPVLPEEKKEDPKLEEATPQPFEEEKPEDKEEVPPAEAEETKETDTKKTENEENKLGEKEDKPEAEQKEKTVDEKEKEAEQKKAEQDEAIAKLAESKKYALPINTIEKRRSKNAVVLGVLLSVLLILIWLDIALDAGIIKLHGVKALTHFFSN